MARLSIWTFFGLLFGIFSCLIEGCASLKETKTIEASSPANDPPNPKELLLEGEHSANPEEKIAQHKIEQAAKTASGKVLKGRPGLSQAFFVSTSVLNVRIGPHRTFRKVGALKEGALVNVSQIEKEWAKFGDDRWVALRYLKVSVP